MEDYLRSQIEVHEEVDLPGLGTGGTSSGGPWATMQPPGDGASRVNATLPPEVQKFSPKEVQLLREAALAVEISPRATKRLVNVTKLIKTIWYRRGEEEPDVSVKHTLILLLALAARYREVMRRLLQELERSFIRKRPSTKLRPVLKSCIAEWKELEGRRADWAAVSAFFRAGEPLPNVTLGEVGFRNVQLVRSFSFVGEVDVRPDPETHQLELHTPIDVSTGGKRKAGTDIHDKPGQHLGDGRAK
jgi:hypothetical protein